MLTPVASIIDPEIKRFLTADNAIAPVSPSCEFDRIWESLISKFSWFATIFILPAEFPEALITALLSIKIPLAIIEISPPISFAFDIVEEFEDIFILLASKNIFPPLLTTALAWDPEFTVPFWLITPETRSLIALADKIICPPGASIALLFWIKVLIEEGVEAILDK